MKVATLIIIFLCSILSDADGQINIWEGTSTKAVELTPFLVSGHENMAVVICPGGSYFWHDIETEGFAVARWLNRLGIAAFVLRYRTAYVPAFISRYRYVFRGNRYPDPQCDLQQSLRLIREQSAAFGVAADKIGVMGFSAGGHLALWAAEYLSESERPAFVAAIYPVVTMRAPYCHKRSRRGLLGDSRKRNPSLCDSLSLEHHVPLGCPPVFLVNCKDDPIVHFHNSEMMDSALTQHHVPHRYIQYATGGHGFGVSDTKGSTESRGWTEAFKNWLSLIFQTQI